MPVGIYPRPSAAERFWARVHKDGPVSECRPDLGPCWLFDGGLTHGYGQIRIDGKNVHAHCWAYEQAYGSVPDGYQLDHLCRVRNCVNPTHLEPVTQRINVLRGISPVAVNARKESCPQGHSYDDTNTYTDRRGKRSCRECHRRRDKLRRPAWEGILSARGGYRGVSWDGKKNKWHGRFKVSGKTTFVGYFDDALQAALAVRQRRLAALREEA